MQERSFIAPAALITALVANVYVRFGTLPLAESLLAGVKPAVIAVIAIAVWRLGKIAVHDAWLGVLGALALAAFLARLSPLLILAGGGLIGLVAMQVHRLRDGESSGTTNLPAGLILLKKSFLLPGLVPSVMVTAAGIPLTKRVPLARLGWFFLKVGAVLYGGGYVLFAFVEQGLVRDHHWLTQQQVLDAIAIGQFTPGPVLSTATFIGYLLGGAWGAVVATVAIFLPSFVYVAALGPILPKLRRSAWMAAFLDSVNACAVALMAGVTVRLAGDALRRIADVGHRCSLAGDTLEVEDQPGMGGAGRRVRGTRDGGVALRLDQLHHGDTVPRKTACGGSVLAVLHL